MTTHGRSHSTHLEPSPSTRDAHLVTSIIVRVRDHVNVPNGLGRAHGAIPRRAVRHVKRAAPPVQMKYIDAKVRSALCQMKYIDANME